MKGALDLIDYNSYEGEITWESVSLEIGKFKSRKQQSFINILGGIRQH